MTPFKLFLERKTRNPLRKQTLQGSPQYTSPEFIQNIREYIKTTAIEDLELDNPNFAEIRKNYDKFKKILPPRAERYLDDELQKYISSIKRPSLRPYKKIHEYQGIQVFLDVENVPNSQTYEPGHYTHRILVYCINYFSNYIRDILPNRKPRVVITDVEKNPETKDATDVDFSPAGLEFHKTIFIDWKYADEPRYYIHEYAHYAADLIPDQSSKMLYRAYKNMLNLYFRAMKTKIIEPEKITDAIRSKIAKKLNFPEYGLLNPDELFAIIIEHWKEFPNNKLTYKFKTLVKQVINRI